MSGPYSISSDRWPGLSKLIEEAGEVQQVAGKIIGAHGAAQHWDGKDTKKRLTEELADLLAAIDFVIEHNDLDSTFVYLRRNEKTETFRRWREEGK